MMRPITKFAIVGARAPSAIADFISMAAREAFNGVVRPVVSRDSARRARREGRAGESRASRPAGMYARLDQEHRRSRPTSTRLADLLVKREEARDPARAASLDLPRTGDRARVRREAEHPGVHERRRPRDARPGSSAEFPAHAPRRVRRSRRHRSSSERRSTSAWATARACASKTVVQIDMSYATVGQQPRHHRWVSSATSARFSAPCCKRRRAAATTAPPARNDWVAVAARQGERGGRGASAQAAERRNADPPVSLGLRDRPVPHRQLDLRRRRRRRGDVRRQRRPTEGAGAMDGSRSARDARRRHRVRDGREARAAAARSRRALR